MARIWCLRCSVRHECELDHGPDGHGGSSICCPIKRREIAEERIASGRIADPGALTDEELAEIEGRTDAAWQEPWESTGNAVGYYDDGRWFTLARMLTWEGPRVDTPNATFIAHARTDVPRLIAALRASRAEVERLEHELAEVSEAFELARAGSWTGWKDMQ